MRIAIAGLGTVGAALVDVLTREAGTIGGRAGQPIQIVAVSARDRSRDRGVDVSGYQWFDDPVVMARTVEADCIVELIGGADGAAKETVETALDRGLDVVTANKALLAEHGMALAARAEAAGAGIAYEAAVAGGIPIVKQLREGLAGNRIEAVLGILNGTCNYILTEMRETGRAFEDVLSEAQALGYAEADPSADVDGHDAAHKLALLAAAAFGVRLDLGALTIGGIRHISPVDIDYARELGYRIKLIASARQTDHGLEQRVEACMVPEALPLATIDGVTNAIVTESWPVGTLVASGPGAGGNATASAVAADLVDAARGRIGPVFGRPVAELVDLPSARPEAHVGAYYLRLMVIDRPGVIAGVAHALGENGVSIASVIQRSRDPGAVVSVVMVTHETGQSRIAGALDAIAALDAVMEPPRLLRIESL